MDYTTSVPRVRQAFLRFARAHPLYDGRHCSLLVTDCSASTITLTCQVSVANAMDVIQVTSDIREAMVEFIAKKVATLGSDKDSTHDIPPLPSTATTKPSQVTQTIALLGLGLSVGSGEKNQPLATDPPITEPPPSPPLPPLTQEDRKMGEGSRMYMTCSSFCTNNDVDVAAGIFEKKIDPSATSTAVSPTTLRDYVEVDVDGSGGGSGGSSNNMAMTGLTRRSIREAVPGEAVVPVVVTEK